MKNCNLFIHGFVGVILVGISFLPIAAVGQTTDFDAGIVRPCEKGATLHSGTAEKECTFEDLVILVKRIIDYIFFFSIPLTAISFSYAGYLYLTAGGNSSKISQANGIFSKVLMGFVVMLSAWLIVKLVASQLLNSNISLPINLGN